MPKLENLFDSYVTEKDWTKSTLTWAKARFAPFLRFLGDKNAPDIEPKHFNRFMANLRQAGYGWSARNGSYTVIAQFWQWLFLNGHIESNFFMTAHKPKRPRKEKTAIKPVAKQHIVTMLKYLEIEDIDQNRRNAAIIRLMAETGIRRMEVSGLKLSQIDFEQGIIYIKGKYGDERQVFISTELRIALKAWLAVRPGSNHEFVFLAIHPNKTGINGPLRPDAINAVINLVKRESGIPADVRITPHQFRHFFASEAAKAENPFALMRLLGHSDIKTTEIYVTVPLSELRRVAGKVRL